MAFDVEGARKAGYSDEEIADYLGQESKFDTAAALKAGYTPEDVISHLSAPAATAAGAPAPAAEEPSFFSKVTDNAKKLVKGVAATNPVLGRALSIAQGPEEKKLNSVLEGKQMPGVPFDAAEAERLSRRDYAEEAERQQRIAKGQEIRETRAPLLNDRQKFAEANPVTAGFAQSAASTLAGTLNAPAAAAGLAGDTVNRVAKSIGLEAPVGRVPNMPLVDDLKSVGQDYASQLSRKSPGKAWDDGDFGRWMLTQLSGNSFSAAQSLGALFVPGAQASLLASMGGISAGNAYAEGDSGSAAALKGLVEVGSEMLPLHAAEKIKDLVLAIPGPARNQVLAEAGKRLLAAGTAVTTNSMVGAIEEVAAEIGGNAIDKYISGKDKSLFEDVDRAALVGAAFGGTFATPAVAEIAAGPRALGNREIAQAIQSQRFDPAQTEQAVMDTLRTEQASTPQISPVASSIAAADAARNQAIADIGAAQTTDQAIEAAQRAVNVPVPEIAQDTGALTQSILDIERAQDQAASTPEVPQLEQMPATAQESSAPAVADAQMTAAGTLKLIGDPAAIKTQLAEYGITKVVATADGAVVGRSQAAEAQAIFNQTQGSANGNGSVASSALAQNAGPSQPTGRPADAVNPAQPGGINPAVAGAPVLEAVRPAAVAADAQPALSPERLSAVAAEPATPTSSKSIPASATHQRVATQLQARIRATYPKASFQAVGIPSGAVGRKMAEAANTAKKLFGLDVAYVKFDGQPLFDGVRSEAFPKTILIRADAPKPHMAVLGHELLHEMRSAKPELYAELGAALDALIKNDTSYAEMLGRRYESQGGKLPKEWREELYGDIVGDNFADPQFWADLAQQKPTTFQRLAAAVRQFLNAILLKAKPFGSDAYLRDIKAARDVVADAVRKFSETSRAQENFSVDETAGADQNADNASQRPTTGTATGAVTPDGFAPASAGHQQLAERLLARIQRGYPNVQFHAVDAPDGRRGQSLIAARTAGKRLFRQDVVFLQFDGPPLFNGVVSDAIPGVVFVRADSDKPHMSILGHELLHQLRKETPDIYSQLSKRLDSLIENESAYASQLAARYERQGGQLPKEWREELHADIVGDNFSNPDFWAAMAKDQPGLFQKVAEAIRKFLDNVLSRAEPFATGQYLRDVEAARDAVADAMRQFSGTQVGALTSQVDGVAMSVASKPEVPVSENNTNSNGQPIASTPEALENFRKWFAGSKVVDTEGNPLVVYRGRQRDYTVMQRNSDSSNFTYGDEPDSGGLFFHPDLSEVDYYMQGSRGYAPGANVLPAYLSIKNPAYLNSTLSLEKQAKSLREAEANGHDGAFLSNGDMVAFRPEQIKSAIGNQGTFDPTNPDIRYSLSPSQTWAIPEESRIDRMIYEMQDSRVDLKRVQESIKEAGRQIEEKFDARTAESLFPGRVAYRSEQFLKAEVRPLLQAMALNKVSMDELADYLHARGAEERNAQIAKINPDMPDGGAGTNSKGTLLTNQAAKDYLANIPADRLKTLDKLAAKVDAITKGTRDLLVSEGLEKPEVVKAWEAAYKNYVPMFRDEAESGNPHPSGGGFSVRGGNSKRATGSTKAVTNILAHVLMQREAAITKAEKNRVGLALYGLALTNPNLNYWATIRPGMQAAQIAADLKAMGVDPVVAEAGMQGVPTVRTVDPVLDRVVDRANPMYKSLPGAVTLKVGGEDRVLLLNEKNERALRMAESLKNLDGLTRFDLAGSIIGQATRWMAAVNTQYNPAFGIVNGIRDTFGGAVNLTSTPLRGKSTQVLLDAYAKAGPAIAKELAKPGGNSEWAKLYRQFQEDGGKTGYRETFKDANDRNKAIENEIRLLEKTGKLTPGKAAHAVLDLLDGFNTTIENAVRLSAYKNALDAGLSRAQSAKLARELTVDFNRKGRAGRELGPLYAFFNASVQGAARTIEALQGPAGAKIIAGGLTLGALQAVMLAMAGFEDDEIPEFVKTRAFIIPIPGKEKRYVAVPLPLGLHVIPNTGRVIAELALNGGKDIGKRAFEGVGEVAGAFNPLGGGNIFTADGALRTALPTILDPIVEIGFNKNFAGNQIERDARGESDVRPGFARAKESTQRALTGQAYLGVSKAINKLTGGSDYEAGLASPTPERLQYIAQVAGGGVLRELEKSINLMDASSKGDKVQQNKIPVIGRLFGEVDEDAVQKSRFYEFSKKSDKAQAALKAAQKAGDADAVRKMFDDHPELLLGKSQDRITQEIAKLNKLAVMTINDRETLLKLDEARLQYMKSLNEAVRAQEEADNTKTLGKRLRQYTESNQERAPRAPQ